ncbi:hypothetical protein [Streptosporangium saharense]|uniref:hypothetical protein n=1 Tax=Streptosporangium saharense TaxID=1706840 RepID=UPI003437E24A
MTAPSPDGPRITAEDSLAMERALLADLLGRAVRASGLPLSRIANQAHIRASSLEAMVNGRLVPRKETLESILDACETVSFLRFDVRYSWERLKELQLRGRHDPAETPPEPSGTAPPPQPHHLRQDVIGYDLKPDPLRAETKEELLALMRDFHVWAGEPSYREIAINAGRAVGASTLCEALDVNRPARMPSLKVVTAFVHGCGGEEEDLVSWTTAWRRIRMARVRERPRTRGDERP